MKRFGFSNFTVRLIASFALLAVGLLAGPKAANATSITEVADSAGAGTTITYSGSGTATFSGTDTGNVALAYSTDWIEFTISPTSGSLASVVVNSVTPYPNSFFEIGTTIGGTDVLSAQSSNNVAYAITLNSGTNYFMSFSSGAPTGTGSQAFGIVATTPESSSLVLLGFGLVGLLGLGLMEGYRSPIAV